MDLIPCKDGTFADPTVGCTDSPAGIVSSQASVLEVILKIADGLLTLAVVIAIGSLLYGAIVYMTGLGKNSQLNRAKNILLWGTIGLIVAVLAKYGVAAVLETISQ